VAEDQKRQSDDDENDDECGHEKYLVFAELVHLLFTINSLHHSPYRRFCIFSFPLNAYHRS